MGATQNKNSCKTAAVVGLLSRGGASRPDVQAPPDGLKSAEAVKPGSILTGQRDEGRLNELARCICERDREDQQLANVMLAHAVEKGRWLTEAKAMVPHGEWGNWLKEKVDYSQSKAQGLMKLYQKFGDEQESLFGPPKSQTLGNLSVTKALMLIDIPDEELGEIMEDHDLESMTTREVAAMKKEVTEAKAQAAQAQADQAAAEQARAKMAEDMARANECISGLNAEVEAQSAKIRKAQDDAARLEKELNELRSRPVEVAVESDPAAIEAARKEAEAAMQDKLNEARAAQEKARADLKEVNSALQRAKLEQEQTRSELEALRAKTAQAEKKVSLASNEDLLLFRTLFDQTQELSNKMSGVLLKVRNKDPEKAAGLSKALLALSEKIRGVAAQ